MFNRLSHTRHITNYHFFYFYEFEIPGELQEYPFEEIISEFIKTYYFTDEFHENKRQREIEYAAHDAFLINNITIDDFKRIKGKDIEKIVLSEIEKESWEAETEEFKQIFADNFSKSKFLLDYLKIDNDEVFYLDKDWFDDTDRLIETHYIYDYLLTFISINQAKTKLLQFDYGSD